MIINKRNSILLALLTLTHTCVLATSLPDPTMPPEYTSQSSKPVSEQNNSVSQPLWVLNSTLIDPYRELAVINGKQVEVGDEINGATVVAITHQQVELLADKKLIVLSLVKSPIKLFKGHSN